MKKKLGVAALRFITELDMLGITMPSFKIRGRATQSKRPTELLEDRSARAETRMRKQKNTIEFYIAANIKLTVCLFVDLECEHPCKNPKF